MDFSCLNNWLRIIRSSPWNCHFTAPCCLRDPFSKHYQQTPEAFRTVGHIWNIVPTFANFMLLYKVLHACNGTIYTDNNHNILYISGYAYFPGKMCLEFESAQCKNDKSIQDWYNAHLEIMCSKSKNLSKTHCLCFWNFFECAGIWQILATPSPCVGFWGKGLDKGHQIIHGWYGIEFRYI